jgi:hypothetical protein
MPHSDIVLNVKGEEEDNPRTVDQVEPNNQVFVIYDTKYTVLYISNSQKKNFMQKYLSGFTDDEVIIKNVYKDIDDFIDNIKSLETIKFTGRRNLLNKDGDLFRPLGDIFGYGGPEEFSIEATYSVRMASSLRRQILRLSGYKAENQIKSLSVIGKDEKGFESVFNSNNFIKKISLSIGKDNQHLFPCDDVKDKILQKLR